MGYQLLGFEYSIPILAGGVRGSVKGVALRAWASCLASGRWRASPGVKWV
jgi:hypothetical protein